MKQLNLDSTNGEVQITNTENVVIPSLITYHLDNHVLHLQNNICFTYLHYPMQLNTRFGWYFYLLLYFYFSTSLLFLLLFYFYFSFISTSLLFLLLFLSVFHRICVHGIDRLLRTLRRVFDVLDQLSNLR